MGDDKSDQKISIKLENVAPFGDRPCGCKGIRTCLHCEKESLILNQRNEMINNQPPPTTIVYIFCPNCETKAWLNDDHQTHHPETCDLNKESSSSFYQQKISIPFSSSTIKTDDDHNHDSIKHLPRFIPIQGITLVQNVIDEDEEKLIVSLIDDPVTPSPWVSSQSGRRKQDYGPKVNFRKQKVKLTSFHGLPDYGHKLFRKLSTVTKVLDNFIPVELCNLEYVPERGSSIDPHLDDDWLWGERLITVNLISETRLTLSPVVPSPGKNETHSHGDVDDDDNYSKVEIEIPLNPRSLLILYGEARYKWYHAIKREHITSRRIGITIRELTSIFLPNGQLYSSIGEKILSIASQQLSCTKKKPPQLEQ